MAAAKELIPATETAAVGDFRPIYAWPPLETEEWLTVKRALPDLVKPVAGQVELRSPNPPGENQRSMILIPRSVLPELDEDGAQIHQWEEDLAETLGRRQIRYGKQPMVRGHLPGHFIGFSGRLSLSEIGVCFENKLYQREDGKNLLPSQAVANDDGSQTFEYRDHLNRDSDFRLEKLHELVMETVAPQIGRLVASNVEVSLKPGLAHPSLFARDHRV